jgi:hypothetical protein
MRGHLVAIVVAYSMAAGICSTEPRAWMRPDGRPIDPSRYERDTSTCRNEASFIKGPWSSWTAAIVNCMGHHGYIPLYRDIFC